MQDEAGGFESRRTGRAAGGEVSRLDAWALRQGGCACGAGIKISISARGQAARGGVLFGRPRASIARWRWFRGLQILVHT
jgi:hypothetical protein